MYTGWGNFLEFGSPPLLGIEMASPVVRFPVDVIHDSAAKHSTPVVSVNKTYCNSNQAALRVRGYRRSFLA